MKVSKWLSAIFALFGIVLAGLTIWLSLNSRDAMPVLVRKSDGAAACARAMMDAVCSGDFAAAGTYMYDCPKLESGADVESESGRLIWQAFVDSLSYELVGECYPCQTGVAQDVKIRYLDFDSVTANLKERSQKLLTQRVADAADVSEVYDESGNYREDAVMDVLRVATEDALREDAAYKEQTVTLRLVHNRDGWWVLPDQALLNAISGGVM